MISKTTLTSNVPLSPLRSTLLSIVRRAILLAILLAMMGLVDNFLKGGSSNEPCRISKSTFFSGYDETCNSRFVIAGDFICKPSSIVMGTAHVPPPVSVQMKLTDTELNAYIMIQEPLWRHWCSQVVASELLDLDDDQLEDSHHIVEKWLENFFPLEFDSILASPKVDTLDFQEDFVENDNVDYLAIQVRYPVSGKIQTLDLQWLKHDRGDGWDIEQVEATIDYNNDLKQFILTRETPRYLWTPPTAKSFNIPDHLFEKPPARRLNIPVVGLVILGLFFAFQMAFFLRKSSWVVRLATTAILTLGAYNCWDIYLYPITDPFAPKFQMLTADQAELLFEGLQRNVYRAFDADGESEIYDALSQSVDQELLENLYGEIYQSLILKEEGNARSTVRGVEFLSVATRFPEDPNQASYSVTSRWRVTGSVEHWGHVHWRTNEYHAEYKVALIENRWKLTEVRVLEQIRLDESGQVMEKGLPKEPR